MRNKILIQTLALVIIAGLALSVGCKPRKLRGTGGNGADAGTQPPPIAGTEIGTAVGARPELMGSDRLHGDFPAVLFDYDSSVIKPSEFSKVEAVANGLRGNSKRLVIEGHTDERGTAEYNRALGERRAQSALKALTSLGIAASRMSTVSYGKDRPVDVSHDDTAWSRNRRCEFILVNQ